MKPSTRENDYFARMEAERNPQAAKKREERRLAEGREREKDLHFMKCPKCGMGLEEIPVGEVRVDKCSGCEGVWLDKGELELIREGEAGFLGRLSSIFRWESAR